MSQMSNYRDKWNETNPHKNAFYCYNRKRRKQNLPGISEQEYLEMRAAGLVKRGPASGTPFEETGVGKKYVPYRELLRKHKEQIFNIYRTVHSYSYMKEQIPELKDVPLSILRVAVQRLFRGDSV